MEQTFQPRQIAYIVSIKDITSAAFVKEEGWSPSYIKIGDKNVSRVNIIGAIINIKDENNLQNISVDDGTARISVKNYEKRAEVGIGDVVLIVGRIRQSGDERYLTPEIVKKNIDKKWSLVWKNRAIKSTEINIQSSREHGLEEIELVKPKSYIDKILSKIKELDDGSGASREEILKIFKDDGIISDLLMNGEIFEIKPGKIKILD